MHGRTVERALAAELVHQALRGRRRLVAIAEIFQQIRVGKARQALDFNDLTRTLQGRTQEELLHYAETGSGRRDDSNDEQPMRE